MPFNVGDRVRVRSGITEANYIHFVPFNTSHPGWNPSMTSHSELGTEYVIKDPYINSEGILYYMLGPWNYIEEWLELIDSQQEIDSINFNHPKWKVIQKIRSQYKKQNEKGILNGLL